MFYQPNILKWQVRLIGLKWIEMNTMGIEIFTSILFRVSALSEPLLFDFGVCFCSLLQAFAHAFDFGHESMEISITLLISFIFLVNSVKGGTCLHSHVWSWCIQHLTFVWKWVFRLIMITTAVSSFALGKAAATLLRGITYFRRLRVRVWWTGIGIGAFQARPSACCPFVPAFSCSLVDCWVEASAP